MSEIWYIADTHFGHGKVIEYCKRPFVDAVHMNTVMINNWNDLVKEDDDVYILGDIAFGKNTLKKWVSKLNGRLHLIIGNHDKTILAKCKEPLTNYFVEIVDYKEIKNNGRTVCMSHYPMLEWNMKHYGSIHLHGHIHNRECEAQEYSKRTENMFNVGADVIGFRPRTLDDLIKLSKLDNLLGGMIRSYDMCKFKYKVTILEILTVIARKNTEEYIKVIPSVEFNKQWRRTLRRLINSMELFDLNSNIKRITGNYVVEKLEVNCNELDSIVPNGYIVYDEDGHTGDYIITFGMSKEDAYSYFNKIVNEFYCGIGMIILEGELIEYGTNF